MLKALIALTFTASLAAGVHAGAQGLSAEELIEAAGGTVGIEAEDEMNASVDIEDETSGGQAATVTTCNGVTFINPGFGFGVQDFNTGCADQTILEGRGLDPSTYERTAVRSDPPVAQGIAVLRALDKITGRLTDLEVAAGGIAEFETLRIAALACYKNPETETPENAAFLQVDDTLNEGEPRVFSGWMFASSPSLAAMEHPIYDVWVVACKN